MCLCRWVLFTEHLYTLHDYLGLKGRRGDDFCAVCFSLEPEWSKPTEEWGGSAEAAPPGSQRLSCHNHAEEGGLLR